jgi:hypothetical protein
MRGSARLAAVALAFACLQAMAGGEMGGADEHPDEGLVFFGFVKDARGAPIASARVTATMKSGNTFIVQTTATGLYRLPTFSKDINPADVVIACAKEGYKQTRVIRRPIAKANPPKPVETECRMERG